MNSPSGSVPVGSLSLLMINRIAQVHHWESLARQARYRDRELARLCKSLFAPVAAAFPGSLRFETPRLAFELRQCDALRLLEEEKAVKEVAFQLGYPFAQHFSRDFKRFHGMTPSAYQNRSN